MALEHCRQQLIGAARDAHPFEACGVITHEGLVWGLRNIRKDEGNLDLFAIHPEDLLQVWDRTAAIWHSHPGGDLTPSARDLYWHPATNARGEPLGMVIVTRQDARVIVPW